MMILIVLFGLLFAMGLFFIIAEVFKLPRLATGKAMLSATSQHKGKAKNLDVLIGSLSMKLAKHLPMDEYKKSRMKNRSSPRLCRKPFSNAWMRINR